MEKDLLIGMLKAAGASAEDLEIAEAGMALPAPRALPFQSNTDSPFEICVKCGTKGENLHDTTYNKTYDLLSKSCGRCGYAWYEYCKDHRSDP